MADKECINIECSNKVEGGSTWCSMECKMKFLLANYSMNTAVRAFQKNDLEFRERQKRVLKEIKDSGMTITEYFKILGAFNEVELKEVKNEKTKHTKTK